MHTQFATITRGLDRASYPMKLWEKAKRLGIWNPSDIDFTQDRADWLMLTDAERDLVLRLAALFQGGEEAVTLDLLPLIGVISAEGRVEEELFLTSFLWEEAKHTDLFSRFLGEVAGVQGDLSNFHGSSYRALIYEALPSALGRLRIDSSTTAQAEASLTYNLIVEGVLAETGYHAFLTMLTTRNLMPGIREGVRLLKQDESRHIAYGIYLLSRLVRQEPALLGVIHERMNDLIVLAAGVIDETFAAYDTVPFGLTHDDFMHYAMDQFGARLEAVERGGSEDWR